MTQSSLFEADTSFRPLAYKLRPKNINEVLGLENNDYKTAILSWLHGGARQSALLWGPPGTGKTTIAQLAAELCNKDFIKLHAFDSGVKDLREIISCAKKCPNTMILFVDEIHNFNKSQQDVLLDALETGVLTLIGATTENPAVSVNRALLSRMIKFELKAIEYKDLSMLVDRAAAETKINITQEARDHLIKASYGDARSLLTNYEMAASLCGSEADKVSELIDLDLAQKITDGKQFSGDPNTYYDCVSALQKSLRGSDPDASLYWLGRLLNSGAELEQVARRILVTASEDVGLADNQALVIANAAYEAALKLGMPEARIPLAQAVAYIAKAPKSNTSYKAINLAMSDCRTLPPYSVPYHLREFNNTCPAKNHNYKGENPISKYKYPHDYPNNWVEQQYLPDEMQGKKYF